MRKLAQLILALSLSAVAACGGSKKQAAEPTPVPAEPAAPAADPAAPAAGGEVTCDQLADHVSEIIMASPEYKEAKAKDPKKMDEMMPQLRANIVQECTDKPFPADVRACVMKAQSMPELQGCESEEGK